ncbi:MAG: AI-2E family transporter [Candidatus Competibacteraceae bacterium]|nr:AI-2E family transporter [Candidatus Competibacteraceae bacterium]
MHTVDSSPAPSEPVRTALRLVIVGSLLLAVLYILRPFLPSLLWSAFIVISVWPGLTWLQRRFRWNRLACTLLLASMLVGVLIGPLLTGIAALVTHGENLIVETRAAIEKIPAEPPAMLADLPLVGSSLAQQWRNAVDNTQSLRARLAPELQKSGRWLFQQVGTVGALFLQLLLVVVFSLVFYVNGAILDALTERVALRIGGAQALQARDQARQAIRSVALGVVLTAIIQSALALVGLLLVGMPLAVLITFICFLLAIAQIGAALPLLVVAGWLYWGQGDTGWALFMAGWGLFVVGGLDNILRPLLITRGIRMPLTLVFTGVIGGLLAFGLIGVFLGPTLVAIAHTLLLAWLQAPSNPEPSVPATPR